MAGKAARQSVLAGDRFAARAGSDVGEGWWPDEASGTYGVDMMIGSENHVGTGLGVLFIQKFIELIKSREANAVSFIIDPDPKNERAIKAFEKAGFVREKQITTPSGQALLMRLKI